ncbi:hypothetical protein BDV95DRAFT_570754 [Massariosphaeria phaeospora]|uniref:polynucleotide adenylyltransferase n=1 Tax=Massariosphaeria phaeospora TaxID=100035 RepID=A0A7C8MA75_9PLEO|nr:hypothetical protein BDV95DRAFT_570754 [Massariosphaeria phaeospora]
MEPGSAPNQASLEDGLRNMILSNVTPQHTQPDQASSSRGQHQQGRSRARFPRGSGRDGQFQTNRELQSSSPATQASQPSSSRGRGQSRPPRQYHQQGRGHQNMQSADNRSTNAQPPRILQRPTNNAPPNNGPPQSQYPPRQQNPQVYLPAEDPMLQVRYLNSVVDQEVPKVEISNDELEEKEVFRKRLEAVCQKAVMECDFDGLASISLVGFGSLASGFATPGSDMDLAIVPEWKDHSNANTNDIDTTIPRLLEKAVLDANMGARLLTRTRVPILKVCQRPTEELYTALSEERSRWDNLSEEEKIAQADAPAGPAEPSPTPKPLTEDDGQKAAGASTPGFETAEKVVKIKGQTPNKMKTRGHTSQKPKEVTSIASSASEEKSEKNTKGQQQRTGRRWLREKTGGPLDFPKSGVGIQCDINFSNPLGLHNTDLLRCYSLCDARVRPMVLFVKSWAKRRKVNSSYSGTLSSYGWVLMVLHYLVNIARPPVCPNLQLLWRPPANIHALEQMFKDTIIQGYPVRFLRNEADITQAARSGQLSQNTQSLGALLRGFFQYYTAVPGTMYERPPAFHWIHEVVSLRTPGGIRLKQDKGWVGARTTIAAGKEVRNRYLFAIEDPFEIDHNVARTVTYNGMVAIRDEFRRAWRILGAAGRGALPEGGLFDEVVELMFQPQPQAKVEKMVTMEDMVADDASSAAGTEGVSGPR